MRSRFDTADTADISAAWSSDTPRIDPDTTPELVDDLPGFHKGRGYLYATTPSDDGEHVTVSMLDGDGAEYDVRLDLADWSAALATTPTWRVVLYDERPKVLTSEEFHHPHRRAKTKPFGLADFIAAPGFDRVTGRRMTTRYLDGDTLNVTRANLVIRPRYAPLHASKSELARAAATERLAVAAGVVTITHDDDTTVSAPIAEAA